MNVTDARDERAAGEVTSWRLAQLGAAGFPAATAEAAARDPRYDLHALIELVERGCSAELAMRILAPLEGASS